MERSNSEMVAMDWLTVSQGFLNRVSSRGIVCVCCSCNRALKVGDIIVIKCKRHHGRRYYHLVCYEELFVSV